MRPGMKNIVNKKNIGLIILISLGAVWYFYEPTPVDMMGKDVDGDGVRDDIQEWIESKKNVTNDYKRALKQYARFHRNSFQYIDNQEQSNLNTRLTSRASNCVTLVNDETYQYLQPRLKQQAKLSKMIRKKVEHFERSNKHNKELVKNKLEWWNKESRRITLEFQDEHKTFMKLLNRSIEDKEEIYRMVYDSLYKRNMRQIFDQYFHGESFARINVKEYACDFKVEDRK
jgi:hypothetical protein